VWKPNVGDIVTGELEQDNRIDPHAVALFNGGNIVGHVPVELSLVTACISGKSKHSVLPDKGQVMPCSYVLIGKKMLKVLRKT